jgi:hypothetical protein
MPLHILVTAWATACYMIKECGMTAQSCPDLPSPFPEAPLKCHTPVRRDVFEV